MKNIIIIQIARLGDIIQSIPLINDIKLRYPKANIQMIVNDVFKDCEVFLKDISVIPVILNVTQASSLCKNIHKDSTDTIAINLNNSPIAKQIADEIKTENRLGFGSENSAEWSAHVTSFLKTRHLNSLNLVDIFRKFISPHTFMGGGDVSFRSNDGTGRVGGGKGGNVAIQCGARNIKRQFTQQHYTDIASHYLNMGYDVYLLGLQSESSTAKAITDTIKHKNLIDTTGKTDLQGLIDIISSCERIYTPDTGTMHLSALCDTPFTTLFCGPAYPFETLGYSQTAEVFKPDKAAFPCYPCKDEEACPYQYGCRKFSFQKHFLGDENKGFTKLKVSFDEIGQVLIPIDDMALLWRDFTKHYFYSLNTKATISPATHKILKRELKLWEMIDINDLNLAEKNFYFLKPLLYYNKLSNDNQLIKEAIKFFTINSG